MGEAVDRVARIVEAAAGRLAVTARADGLLHGDTDLADVVTRLRAFAAAGADVLFAPGVSDLGQVTSLLGAVSAPLSVMLLPGGPSPTALADAGVSRLSVGPFAGYAAYAALADLAAAVPARLLGTATTGDPSDAATGRFWRAATTGAGLMHGALAEPTRAR
jgi:2-methylisocitrate lyase-like PEP mutase family enzyme